MSSLRVILWDIDGTLLRTRRHGSFKDYTRPVLARMFGTAGRLEELSVSGMTDLQIVSEALRGEGFTPEQVRERAHLAPPRRRTEPRTTHRRRRHAERHRLRATLRRARRGRRHRARVLRRRPPGARPRRSPPGPLRHRRSVADSRGTLGAAAGPGLLVQLLAVNVHGHDLVGHRLVDELEELLEGVVCGVDLPPLREGDLGVALDRALRQRVLLEEERADVRDGLYLHVRPVL